MKLQGILGKGTGKLGNAVFAVSGGEQIMREYNPNVSNPNTEKQVAQRAKLKLLSQVAAALSSAIAIPKEGLVSSRNLFIKLNFDYALYANGEANVDLSSLQLTKSTLAMPSPSITEGEGKITVQLEHAAPVSFSRVAYVVCKVDTEKKISVETSAIATEAGEGRNFAAVIPVERTEKLIVYAYGMIDKSSVATAKYENYQVENTLDLATLVSGRALGAGDFVFTQTNSTTLQ